jgi:Arc/MetJ-type ribon-helix-helix transcriptional regulator
MTRKRVTVSLDADLVEYAKSAVREGRAESVSGWVNQAMRRYLEEEKAFRAAEEAIAAYEAEFGAITDEDIAEAERWMEERAIVVNPPEAKRRRSSTRRRRPEDGAA